MNMSGQGTLRRVGSRDSLLSLRDSTVISTGGSKTLFMSLSALQRRPRKAQSEQERLTYITCIIQDLQWALEELAGGGKSSNATETDLEMWGCFIDRQLSQASRNYHSVSHVFEISAGASPLQVLASMFRDIVNYSIDIDGGVAARHVQPFETSTSVNLTAEGIIEGVLVPGTHTVSPDLQSRDLLIARIFGFQPEQDLSGARGWHKGLDIFLSAMVATRMLRKCLTAAQEAELAVCLEATIPNRLKDKSKPLEDIYLRLADCNGEFGLAMTEEHMISTVQQACDIWNRQVGNLMSSTLAPVLDHTWMLLPELNPALRKRSLYKLNDYHMALQSMTNVIGNMKGSTIVMEFRGIPTRTELKQFEEAVNKNMELVVLYMKARLLSVAIVAAFATLTGGDAPKSFFFGDVPLPHEVEPMDVLGEKLLEEEDRIDTVAKYRAEVYKALCGEGMGNTSSFDTQQAPLAAYLYRTLGDDRIGQILEECNLLEGSLPLDENVSWALLRAFPRPIIFAVAEEMQRFTVSRSAALSRILPSL